MVSYYNQVEEAIKNNQRELVHLQDELKGLRSVEKDTPRESYQRQYAQILYHIDQEQRRLEENKLLLQTYDEAYRTSIELKESRNNIEIEQLRGLLSSEGDSQIRREILEELEKREEEHESRIRSLEEKVRTSMSNLTDELADELEKSLLTPEEEQQEIVSHSETDQSISHINPNESSTEEANKIDNDVNEDNKETKSDTREQELQTELEKAENDYSDAEADYKASIEKLQNIFNEEITRKENEGPFKTEEELDNFTSDYMRQKIEETARLEAAKARIAKARRKINRLERRIEERLMLKEEANEYSVDVDVYEKIKKAVEKKEVVSAVYEKKGLGVVSKNDKENKEQYDQVTKEMIEQIIKKLKDDGIITSPVSVQQGDIYQNDGAGINVIDTINIIYGTDIPVKAGNSRKTTISEDDKDNVRENQKKKVKVRKVPHNGNEQKGKTPGKAPEDMEGAKTPAEQPILPNNDEKSTETGATVDENPSSDSGNNNQEGSKEKPIDVISPGINQDGTYRLKKDQIIQDDIPRRTQPTPSNPIKPTGMVPYEPKPTGIVPYEPKPTGVVPYEPKPTGIVPTPKPKKDESKNKPKRTLTTIIDDLTDGLDLKAKDGKRYKASNVKVAESFKEELKSGNYLYNIVHLVPAIIKIPFNFIRKITGKLMMSAKSKKSIATFKKRLDKMIDDYKKTGDDTDLMTIFKEYRGNRVLQEQYPTILNTLLDETMQKFALDKVVRINSELEQRYTSAFVAIRELEAIDRALADPKTSDKDKMNLRDYRAKLLKGQSTNISSIRQGYNQANEWLSGGAHGFSEDMKAATTKLSVVGKRFTKEHDLDHDLVKKQAQLESAEAQAIVDGNDEMALRTFVQIETLLSSHTEIKGSIFGKRSTGKKYYSPLAEQLDYRDDPFIRDLFTTIAVTSAAISTVQSIAHAREQADIIAENQRRIADNNQKMAQVNQIGSDIASKRGTMMDGMQSQGMQDTISGANEIERAILDKTDWGIGKHAFKTADQTGHTYFTNFYNGTKSGFDNIAQQYAAGQITQAQAMQMISDLSSKTHQTFGQINEACLDILRPYAQIHQHIDLTGVQGAMEFLQANPDAISAMNQAMVDVTNAGDVLASMQLEPLIPLTTLPSNIRTVIINGASTAALASNINNSMGARKHTYGNSVTDMVDEYVEQRNSEQNATAKEIH